MVIFATLYIGFFAISKAMVEKSVSDALSLAVIDSRLVEEPPPCGNEQPLRECCDGVATDWCDAYRAIEAEATRIAESSILRTTKYEGFAFIDESENPVTVKIPIGTNLNDQVVMLRDNPITIAVDYWYLDVFGNWTPSGKALGVGFYEVSSNPAYNVPSDCLGNPQHSPGL